MTIQPLPPTGTMRKWKVLDNTGHACATVHEVDGVLEVSTSRSYTRFLMKELDELRETVSTLAKERGATDIIWEL